MIRSSLVKWAIAALLAVPAASTFAATKTATIKHHHRTLTRLHHKHVTLASQHRHHKLTHKSRKHTSLASRRHRHSSLSASSAAHPTIKITKIPPTIDGMNT